MRISGNRIADIKLYFYSELAELYPESELLQLFRMAAYEINTFSPIDLHMNANDRVTESQLLQYSNFVKRLKNSEPVQYITGYQWFMDLKIAVNKDVLIPRPETEELVNQLIEELKIKDPVILDACTGSGCIALALKNYMPLATVYGCDVSTGALTVANQNGSTLNLDVTFFEWDVLQSPEREIPALDVLISNPPYIPFSEESTLSNHVKSEPALALFVPDNDPLLFFRHLADWGLKFLKPGGRFLAECHRDKTADVAELLRNMGYGNVIEHEDLSGNKRWVSGAVK